MGDEVERLKRQKLQFLILAFACFLPLGIYAPMRDPEGGVLDVVFIALLSYQPAVVLFGLFVAYFLSGFVVSAWTLSRRRRNPPAPS